MGSTFHRDAANIFCCLEERNQLSSSRLVHFIFNLLDDGVASILEKMMAARYRKHYSKGQFQPHFFNATQNFVANFLVVMMGIEGG